MPRNAISQSECIRVNGGHNELVNGIMRTRGTGRMSFSKNVGDASILKDRRQGSDLARPMTKTLRQSDASAEK